MQRVQRKTAAAGTAMFLIIGSSALMFPGTAVADTKSTNCGGSVEAQVGDTILGNTSVLGLDLGLVNLGTVEKSGVLSKTVSGLLCEVTVTVTQAVDEVSQGAADATKDTPLGGAVGSVNDGVQGGTNDLREAAGATPPADDGSQPGDGSSGSDPSNGDPAGPVVPPPNYPAWGGSVPGFAYNFGGFSPMQAFDGFGAGSLFDTAPGLRYGAGFGDYAPEFGMLGDGGAVSGNPIRNAGQAQALPPLSDSGIGLPMLLAVLALAGASAGLVRTWVLRLAAGESSS